jgi:hypothetical protein
MDTRVGLWSVFNYKEMPYIILHGQIRPQSIKSALGWLLEQFSRLLDVPALIFVNLE